MQVVSVFLLEKSTIRVSDGGTLDGVAQGDGSHLVGKSITLAAAAWKETFLTDDDSRFDDSDGSQRLSGAQTINGVVYADGVSVRVAYTLVLRDPVSSRDYVAYGYNLDTGTPAYATVGGLSFAGGASVIPPTGTALEVIRATEAPEAAGQDAVPYTNLAYPVCFAGGTLILTPQGQMPVDLLRVGDRVMTRDHGPQTVRWVGSIALSAEEVSRRASLRAVEIAADAFGKGQPVRRFRVSQQHRILMSGWKSELLFGAEAVLVAARDLVNDQSIRVEPQARAVSYHHILLDRHEVVWAEGVETESLYPVGLGPMNLPSAHLAELDMLFPDIFEDMSVYGATARPCLKPWEGRVLAP